MRQIARRDRHPNGLTYAVCRFRSPTPQHSRQAFYPSKLYLCSTPLRPRIYSLPTPFRRSFSPPQAPWQAPRGLGGGHLSKNRHNPERRYARRGGRRSRPWYKQARELQACLFPREDSTEPLTPHKARRGAWASGRCRRGRSDRRISRGS